MMYNSGPLAPISGRACVQDLLARCGQAAERACPEMAAPFHSFAPASTGHTESNKESNARFRKARTCSQHPLCVAASRVFLQSTPGTNAQGEGGKHAQHIPGALVAGPRKHSTPRTSAQREGGKHAQQKRMRSTMR